MPSNLHSPHQHQDDSSCQTKTSDYACSSCSKAFSYKIDRWHVSHPPHSALRERLRPPSASFDKLLKHDSTYNRNILNATPKSDPRMIVLPGTILHRGATVVPFKTNGNTDGQSRQVISAPGLLHLSLFTPANGQRWSKVWKAYEKAGQLHLLSPTRSKLLRTYLGMNPRIALPPTLRTGQIQPTSPNSSRQTIIGAVKLTSWMTCSNLQRRLTQQSLKYLLRKLARLLGRPHPLRQARVRKLVKSWSQNVT